MRKNSIAVTMILVALSGCGPSTRHLEAVDDFDIERYVGQWYEIARFPHRFERGLTDVTATYTLLDNGMIQVLNRGYSPDDNEWKQVVGKAEFIDSPHVGHLEVTFFWPFRGDYKILELDREHYSYALVTSSTYDYLWILARTPTLDESTHAALVSRAGELGFDTSRLKAVDQSKYTEGS